jgi:hypothetical protein
MATVALRKPRVKPERRAAYHRDLGVLYLSVGKEHFGYYVDPLPSDYGRAWLLTKFRAQRKPGEAAEYHFNAGGDGHAASCECKGSLRWHHCKHVESLTDHCKHVLTRARSLPDPFLADC